jgi:predicted amidohydrolase YtcJ
MADFIFIDRDIFRTSNPAEIRETQVLETWLGGTKVWDRATRNRNPISR